MPKVNETPISAFGWLVVVVVLSLGAWVAWSQPATLLLIPAALVLSFLERRKLRKHFAELLRERESRSICTFARHFDRRRVDTWVIRAVYEQLQSHVASGSKEFPILPADDVFTDLKIDDEDFEFDVVYEIAERTGRSLEDSERNPYFGRANIVENLVLFFNEQPRANAT